MPTVVQSANWKALTPESLQKAVSRIRDCFEERAVMGCRKMESECHPEIHFHSVSIGSTEMTVYERHFKVCIQGLEVADTFRVLLNIAGKHAPSLDCSPVEWAESHMRMLISETAIWGQRWLKSACDRQYAELRDDTPEYFELMDPKKWLAPRCTSMGLFASRTYDHATAWTRDNESRTQHILEAARYLYLRECSADLDRAVGDAHIHLALLNPVNGSAATDLPPANSYRPLRLFGEMVSILDAEQRELGIAATDLKLDISGSVDANASIGEAIPGVENSSSDKIASIEHKIRQNPRGVLRHDEAAHYFGVTTKTIRAWKNGEVASRKLTQGAKRGTVTIESVIAIQNNPDQRKAD